MSYISLILILLFTSCSNYQFRIGSASVIGAMGGYAISKKTSPNKESESINNLIGILTGLVGGVGLGYTLHELSDPTKKVKPIMLDNEIIKTKQISDFNIEETNAQ